MIGAIYPDSGIRPARAFVHRIFAGSLSRLKRHGFLLVDYKTQLQEYLANTGRVPPRYVKVAEEGPDHDKLFTMQIEVVATSWARGGDTQEGGPAGRRAARLLENLQGREGDGTRRRTGGSANWHGA